MGFCLSRESFTQGTWVTNILFLIQLALYYKTKSRSSMEGNDNKADAGSFIENGCL